MIPYERLEYELPIRASYGLLSAPQIGSLARMAAATANGELVLSSL
jgi:hypothetical protein